MHKNAIKTLFLAFTLLFSCVASSETLSFEDAKKQISSKLNCDQEKVTPASFGYGALYGCISGGAETAKVFINEEAATGKVENIKVMWNDWFKDVGFGLHPDKKEAQKYLEVVSSLFTPSISKDLNESFFNTSKNKSFQTDKFNVKYTYNKGPAIAERLITISPK